MKSNIKKVETTCNNCGSSSYTVVTTGREHEYDNTTDDVFSVVRCSECGLVYLNPRPDISELSTIYPPNYYAYKLEDRYDDSQRNSAYYKARYKRIVDGLERTLRLARVPTGNIKLLDIGCADGHILNWFRQVSAHKVDTYGVDLNQDAVEKARAQGHTAWAGRFEDIEIEEDMFDVVFASHVIEHVPDPKAFTQKAFKILKPGGIFWFYTPNIGSVDARWFRNQHWGAYHFPRHWVFYDADSARRLAQATGFEVALIEYEPNAIFWVWTFHSMMKANPSLSRYADACFPPIDWSSTTFSNLVRNASFHYLDCFIRATTGQTSNMCVIYRKPT